MDLVDPHWVCFNFCNVLTAKEPGNGEANKKQRESGVMLLVMAGR